MVDAIIDKLIEGNKKYQWKLIQELETVEIKEKIPKYPVLILTCMDPRIDVHRIFQLNPGDVFVLRNAGNQYSEDVLRSLLIAIHEYYVRYIIVLGHLDCGMKKIDLDGLRNRISPSLLKQIGQESLSIRFALQKFFKSFADEIINITSQVEQIRTSKYLPPNLRVIGMLYDPNSGWIFNESEFSQYQFSENFMKNYREIIQKKKINQIDFLERIESEIVGEKVKPDVKSITLEYSKGPEEKLQPVGKKEAIKESPVNLYNEAKEILEDSSDDFELPKLEKFMNVRVNVSKPIIHVPKVKVYLPSINKSKEDED